MLSELRISNFALIDDLDVSFSSKMNVLLGETGAGKSLLVDAISLLSGKRADFGKLKDESKKALIEGTFTFSEDFIRTHKELEEYIEGNSLTITRVLLPSKSAIARINGETISLSSLRKIAEQIIDIHSQQDSSLLYDEKNYLSLLDSYKSSTSNLNKVKEEYSKVFKEIKELQKEKEEFITSNNISDKDYLEFQVKEIQKFDIKENEIEDLNEELMSLESFEQIENTYSELEDTISPNSSITFSDLISKIRRILIGFNNSSLEEQAKKLSSSLEEVEENILILSQKYENLDFSPKRIDEINQRLFSLTSLQRKYGKSTSDILEALKRMVKTLEDLNSYDDKLKEFELKEKELDSKIKVLASKLTSKRKDLASSLEKEVNSELESLGLLSGGFKIEVLETQISSSGQDNVSFKICMNKGSKFISLKEAASGGENSRLNLALKSVFNKLKPYDTLIFDEIDTGVSGAIASKVANKIHELSSFSSIIVITHLPQVVARGDSHYFASKQTNQNTTTSSLEKIEGERVVIEVAKMLSGDELNNSAIQAARELISSYKL
ncbi:MAG: DNA repair protein RecN [Bacilli bacterium]|nr:DNA repair protein RecN [Bacilli bacterium]